MVAPAHEVIDHRVALDEVVLVRDASDLLDVVQLVLVVVDRPEFLAEFSHLIRVEV